MQDRELTSFVIQQDVVELTPPSQYSHGYPRPPEVPVYVSVFLGAIIIVVLVSALYAVNKLSSRSLSLTSLSNIVLATVIGFVSSIAISGLTLAIIFAVPILSNLVSQSSTFFWPLFISVISIGIYITLGFAPSMYIGAKKRIGWGMFVFSQTLAWLHLYLLMGMIIVSII